MFISADTSEILYILLFCFSAGNKRVVQQAAECLLNGHIISVPTDTVYGIAGLAQNSDAISSIYDIKKRNLKNPIAISVGCVEDFYK